MTKKSFQDGKEKTVPWANDHYYLINDVKYAYETIDELDFIWLYDGMGKVYVNDVKTQGYQVIEPKLTRNNVKPQARSKMPSAGSISYYKKAACIAVSDYSET